MNIPEEFLKKCRKVYTQHYFANIFTSEIKEILMKEEHQSTLSRELEYNSPSDTGCREWLAQILAQDIGSIPFPSGTECAADPELELRFWKDYLTKLKAKYRIKWPDGPSARWMEYKEPNLAAIFNSIRWN